VAAGAEDHLLVGIVGIGHAVGVRSEECLDVDQVGGFGGLSGTARR
jgi:hypothetical protein